MTLEERLRELEHGLAEAHAYMAALSIAVASLCEVTPLDPAKINSRFDELKAVRAPPDIAARAGHILGSILPPTPVRQPSGLI